MSYTGNEPKFLTQPPADNSTKAATTEYVDTAVAAAGGGATVVDSIADGDTTNAPSRNAVFDALALKADLASPAFTGTPTAPTQAALDNSTKVATTEYVDDSMVAAIAPLGSIIPVDGGNSYTSVGAVSNFLLSTGLTIGEKYQINVLDVTTSEPISLGSASGLADYLGSGVPPVTGIAAGTYFFTAVSTSLYYNSASALFAGVGNLRTKAGVLGLSSALVSGLNIDWSLSNIFYQEINAAATYTFSNIPDGKTISMIITNAGGAAATVAFPAGIKVKAGFVLSVPAGKANIYTFMRANGITYASYVDGLV